MKVITAIIFLICLGFFGAIEITKSVVKEDYCKYKHERHIDVNKCKDAPFPWKNK